MRQLLCSCHCSFFIPHGVLPVTESHLIEAVGQQLYGPEVVVVQPKAPAQPLERLEADAVSAESHPDVATLSVPVDVAGGIDSSDGEGGWVQERPRSMQLPLGGLVHLRRRLAGERIVGADVIEFLSPSVQLSLLRARVGSGADFLSDVAMHALVTAVVLGAAGAASYDADAQRGPPSAQLREAPAAPGRDERAAIVALKRGRQTVLAKERLKLLANLFARGRGQDRHRQDVATVCIAHRQRLAAAAVMRAPPALEVDRPNL